MRDKIQLPVAKASGLGRREVLQGLFAGVGGGLMLPGWVEAHTMEPAFTAAVAKAKIPDAKPAFLGPHEFATLGVLCTRIVPGSEKALTDRFIDELLAVATPERRQRFLSALGALEGESIRQFQRPLRALTEAQQVEVLQAASAGKPGQQEWVWTPGTPVQKPEVTDEEVAFVYSGSQRDVTAKLEGRFTLRDHFDHVKTWITGAYYSSEAGLRELGYTGQTFFLAFPDCTHPEHS